MQNRGILRKNRAIRRKIKRNRAKNMKSEKLKYYRIAKIKQIKVKIINDNIIKAKIIEQNIINAKIKQIKAKIINDNIIKAKIIEQNIINAKKKEEYFKKYEEYFKNEPIYTDIIFNKIIDDINKKIIKETLKKKIKKKIKEETLQNYIFYWIYNPSDILSSAKIRLFHDKYQFNEHLLFLKIAESKIRNGKQIEVSDKIYFANKLTEHNFTNLINIAKIKATEKKLLFSEIKININILAKKYIKYNVNNNYHADYCKIPLPDPVMGRPRFLNCKCQYYGCNKLFDIPSKLINHLQKNKVNINIPIHKNHQYIVDEKKLTRNIIIEQKIIRCPSYICMLSDKIFTPEELCDHFKFMGIQPFWKSGMVIINSDLPKYYFNEANKIYINNMDCIICYDDITNIILFPCGHNNICYNCYCSLHTDNCIMCNQKIKYCLLI